MSDSQIWTEHFNQLPFYEPASSSVAEAKPERLSEVIHCALDIEADHRARWSSS